MVCAVLCDLWGETNNRMSRGVERNSSDVKSLVRSHASLWISISFIFWNYFMNTILHNWGPSNGIPSFFFFVGLVFCMSLYSFILFIYLFSSTKVVAIKKKNNNKLKTVKKTSLLQNFAFLLKSTFSITIHKEAISPPCQM